MMNEYLVNLLLKIHNVGKQGECYLYDRENFSNSEDARREEDGLRELKDMKYIEISERKNHGNRHDSTRYRNILVTDITYKGKNFIREYRARENLQPLETTTKTVSNIYQETLSHSYDHRPDPGNQQVYDSGTRNQSRLNKQIYYLDQNWELLNKKLFQLERELILETRSEEKFRLEILIDDTKIKRDQVKEQLTEIESQLAESSRSPDNDFFGQPNKLCSALDSEALKTQGWKPSNAFPGEFICMTTLVSFGLPSSNGMENNIAYYVNGTQADRANDIRVKININNPSERAQAFDRLSMATKTLFKAIEEPVPIELSEALAAEQPISLDTTFGKVELIHEPGNIDSFKIVLTDKRFLTSQQAAKMMFADDFEACRFAVAKAAGYGISSITGDGQPISESDHRSFLFNGKDNDIFSCEIYPGRKYKIKAAFGSKFPFKYIAEGVL